MNRRLAALPHFFTITNIFLGFTAVIYTARESFITAAWLIIIAAVFDNLDGMTARLTKTNSKFGVELDSLADVISFGLAPSFLIYRSNFSLVGAWGVLFSFMFLLAGVFRLARYNTSVKGFKKKSFSGLPIPLAAMGITTFMIWMHQYWDLIDKQSAYLFMVPALSLLMVSNIEYERIPRLLLSRSVRKNANALAYLFGFLCVLLYPKQAFFPFTMLYILKGLFFHLIHEFRSEEQPCDVTVEEDRIAD